MNEAVLENWAINFNTINMLSNSNSFFTKIQYFEYVLCLAEMREPAQYLFSL